MLTSIGDIMREAHRRNWITTRDGNISVRRQNVFYITPSGVRKTIIHPEHIIKLLVTKSGKLIDKASGVVPSGELEMHRLIQTTDFKGPRAVVHLHPTYCIAAMHAGFDLKKLASEFPEVSRYTRVASNVPVLPVTSEILAKETFSALTESAIIDADLGFGESSHVEGPLKLAYDIVGQAGHGVCAIGNSPWDAFEHIERLEHICQIVLASGVKPNDKNRIL